MAEYKYFKLDAWTWQGYALGRDHYDEALAREYFEHFCKLPTVVSVMLYGYPTAKADEPVLLESWHV